MVLSRVAPLLLLAGVSSTFSLGFSTCRGSADGPSATTGGGQPQTTDVDLSGVDVSSLTPRERREWSSYVSEMLAPCADTPVSIAQCVREKRACTRCMPAARFLVKEVRDGRTREQATEGYRQRFDNDRVKNIDVSDTPIEGPLTAPVTIVEWADFECPFCKRAAPILESMVDKFPGKVRFFFKTYPLSIHAHAQPAARAAVAAGQQGKFWEMHHKLFDKAPALDEPELDKYAQELGLQLPAWKTAMDSEQVKARVARDSKQADALGLQGTPLVYINGREFESKGDFATELEEWVRIELELVGSPAPPAAPAPPASAAPKASVAASSASSAPPAPSSAPPASAPPKPPGPTPPRIVPRPG